MCLTVAFLSFVTQLVLIASVGKSYEGDIAIDDISVSEGYCGVVPPSPSLPGTPPLPSQGPSVSPGNIFMKSINITKNATNNALQGCEIMALKLVH